MAIEQIEYMTVYTAAMEREYIRSQQRPPNRDDLPKRRELAQFLDGSRPLKKRAYELMALEPETWWTTRAVAEVLLVSLASAKDALVDLAQDGRVVRMYARQDIIGRPAGVAPLQRYRVKA